MVTYDCPGENGNSVEYKTKGGSFDGTDRYRRYGTKKEILTVIT